MGVLGRELHLDDQGIADVEQDEGQGFRGHKDDLDVLPSHYMEENSKIMQSIVAYDALDVVQLVGCPLALQPRRLLPHPIDLLRDAQIDHPVEEGDEVAGVETVPQSACHDGVELGLGLNLFAGLFVLEVGVGVVDGVIDVALEGDLDGDVPALDLDLDAGVEEETPDLGDGDFVELLTARAVAQPRQMNAHQAQAPRRYVLELDVGNRPPDVQQLVRHPMLAELRPRRVEQLEHRGRQVHPHRQKEHTELLAARLPGRGNALVVAFSVQVILVVPVFESGPNQGGREEENESHVGEIVRPVHYFAGPGPFAQLVVGLGATLVIESEPHVEEDLHHQDSCDVDAVNCIGDVHSPGLNPR